MSCKKCNTNKCTCETNLCINPLVYLVKTALPIVENYISEIEEFIDNNNKGREIPAGLKEEWGIPSAFDLSSYINLSMTNSGTLCCPDCKNGIYYLGNYRMLNAILENGEKICCIEYLALNLRIKNFDVKCCGTDFLSSVQAWLQQLSNYNLENASFALDEINSIVEVSSFNGYSGLGILLNFLQLNYPNLDEVIYVLIMGVILTYGVVIKCDGCQIQFYTAQTYLETLGDGGGGGIKDPFPRIDA